MIWNPWVRRRIIELKTRLLAVAVAALLPALCMLAYNEVASRRDHLRDVAASALRASQQAASELDGIIDGVNSLLIATSAIPAIAARDAASCAGPLKAIAAELDSVQSIAVIGADGRLICDSAGALQGTDRSSPSYFKDALARRAPTVGEFTISPTTHLKLLPVALPVVDAAGQIREVIVADVRLDWLGKRLQERGLAPGAALTVADRNGVILARHPLSDRFVGTRIPDDYINLVHAPEPGTIELRSQDGFQRIMGYQPATAPHYGLYVSTGFSKDEAFAAINRASVLGALFVAGGAVVAFSAAWIVGTVFIRRPIDRIVAVLGAWQSGASEMRTGMKAASGELELVGDALDRLLDELAVRQAAAEKAERHRDLIMRELAHRVKNTLAVVTAIAQQSFRDVDDRERVRAFARRISALAGAYDVLLAETSNSADLRSIVEKTLLPHRRAENDPFRPNGPPVMLPPQAVLSLSLVLHELATNAAKYGALQRDSGRVIIEWSVDDGRVSLLWREEGGPMVTPPSKAGFGSQLIRTAFRSDFEPEVTMSFEPDGLHCRVQFQANPGADDRPAA